MNNYKTKILIGLLLVTTLQIGCSDWQTSPVTVDKHFGNSVRHTMANQTLYPEHSKEEKQVLLIDGRKAESIIRAYRMPSESLIHGKTRANLDINESGGGRQ